MKKTLFCWSGGKDSAFSLWEILKAKQYRIEALLTTVTKEYDRISMHGVRRSLLEEQAALLGIPLEIVWITRESSNEDYERQMDTVLQAHKKRHVSNVVFGDIFLEDLRNYREEKLGAIKMKGLFPIWKRNTKELAREFIRENFKAVITCVDTTVLDASFAGREFNESLLSDLPPTVDPCGENGEFHSFVVDGPIFKKPIFYSIGEKSLREKRFFYCDLIPA